MFWKAWEWLKAGWRPVGKVLGGVRDWGAWATGARCERWRWRLGHLAAVNAALVAGIWYGFHRGSPALSLALSILALVLLLSAYSAWGVNEDRRGRIAKKIDPIPQGLIPDLRGFGVAAAALIALYLPAMLAAAHGCYGLFVIKEGEQAGPIDWGWFLLGKTYLRFLPDALDLWFTRIEGLHGIISYRDRLSWGHAWVLVAYVLVAWTVVKAVGRAWQINRDVREGIKGVRVDPDMAVRLLRRAVRPLMREWQKPGQDDATLANIATALGGIGDRRAYVLLRGAAYEHSRPAVQAAALRAMAEMANHDSDAVLIEEVAARLREVLSRQSETWQARAAAATGLGTLKGDAAGGHLLEHLKQISGRGRRPGVDANIRKEILRAVGGHFGRRRADPAAGPLIDEAVRLILAEPSLLEDNYLRVRNKAAVALGRLGHRAAIGPLTRRLDDPLHQNQKLLVATLASLGSLLQAVRLESRTDAALAADRSLAIKAIRAKLDRSGNDDVRQAAARALGQSGDVSHLGHLLDLYREALRHVHEEMAEALREAAEALRPGPELKADLARMVEMHGRARSQRRREDVANPECPVERRVEAARELGEALDHRGVDALQRALSDPSASPELQEACRAALARLTAPPATTPPQGPT
jgi:HEAT repeat protein